MHPTPGRHHLEELDERLSDPDIDDRTAARLTREAVAILNKVPELKGWLTARTQIEVKAERNLLTDFTTIAVDEDGNFHGLVDR